MMFSLDSMARLLELSLGCGAVIALLLALTPLLSRRLSPKWRYTAWLLLCIRLVSFSGLDLRSLLPFRAPVRLEMPQAVVQNAYDPREDYLRDQELARREGNFRGAGSTTDMEGTYYRYHIRYEDTLGRDVVIKNDEFSRTVTVDGVSARSVHWTAWAGLGWFLTAIGCYAVSLGGYFRFRKRALSWSSPAGEEDRAALAVQLERRKVKNPPELFRCSLVRSPMLMGVAHPVILLPEDLPAAALEAALAHEVCHLKRRDIGYLNVLVLARSIHWFNPLVWMMVRQARQDAELCCDYDLLKDQGEAARRSYGQAILDQMTAGKREGPSLTTGFSGSKAEVFRRFRAIMDLSPKRWGRTALALAACATLLAGGLVACDRTGSTAEDTVSVTLEDETVQVPFTSDGSEPDPYPLPVLTFPLSDTRPQDISLQLSLPHGEVQLQLDQTFRQAAEISRHDSYPLSADEEGRCTVYFQLFGSAGEETVTFHLTWGDEGQYRCAFQVEARYPASTRKFTGRMGGPNTYLVHGTLSSDLTAVLYERVDWFRWDDPNAEDAWWRSHWETGWLEELTAPLAPDAELLYYFNGTLYPLNPATIEHSIWQAQDGALMELILNGEGQVEQMALRGGVSLDLDAANLDFTGFSGEVYSLSRPAVGPDGTVSFDPCGRFFQDKSDERYTLPAGPDLDLERLDRSPGSGCYFLELENGAVVSVEDYLKFSDKLDRHNSRIDFSDLTASLGVHTAPGYHENEPCYRFENTAAGILLEVFPASRHNPLFSGYDCLLSFGGRSKEFQLADIPLSQELFGPMAGECEFYLTDLTGDGVPEFIYIDSYPQARMYSNRCRVFDPAAMEEYDIILPPEYENLLASIRLEFIEQQDNLTVLHLSDSNGNSLPVPFPLLEDAVWDNEAAIEERSCSFQLDRSRTALALGGSIQMSGPGDWHSCISFSPGSFVFHPQQKVFQMQGPFALEPTKTVTGFIQRRPVTDS